MTEMLLTRTRPHAAPQAHVLDGISVPLARVHEICGPARRTLALIWAAAVRGGPVIWIASDWTVDRLHSAGVQSWLDPSRILFVTPRKAPDVLWSLEEALRMGGGVVIGDLSEPPGLTVVRRLHLAAEAGARAGRPALSLLLTPGDGGAAGVETRWFFAPRHGPAHATQATGIAQDRWRLERRRARMVPPSFWEVIRVGGLLHLHKSQETSENL